MTLRRGLISEISIRDQWLEGATSIDLFQKKIFKINERSHNLDTIPRLQILVFNDSIRGISVGEIQKFIFAVLAVYMFGGNEAEQLLAAQFRYRNRKVEQWPSRPRKSLNIHRPKSFP